jgi:hypothetical protein
MSKGAGDEREPPASALGHGYRFPEAGTERPSSLGRADLRRDARHRARRAVNGRAKILTVPSWCAVNRRAVHPMVDVYRDAQTTEIG